MSFKFNPLTGQLDYFEEQTTPVIDAAKRLEDSRVCSEDISALKLVIAISDTNIILANKTDYINSKVLGISLQAGVTGSTIDVLLFGKIEDPFFSFPLNEPLFLDLNGTITNVPPTIDFSVNIGHSLGVGAIFIDIKEQIQL